MRGPAPLVVLYRDEDCIIVDKPAGIIVHRGWANDHDDLMRTVRDSVGQHVFPLHRLDRGASGAVAAPSAARSKSTGMDPPWLRTVRNVRWHRTRDAPGRVGGLPSGSSGFAAKAAPRGASRAGPPRRHAACSVRGCFNAPPLRWAPTPGLAENGASLLSAIPPRGAPVEVAHEE
jgi:hypothetical protein